MALTATISKAELARVANLAYEGETLKVMLCLVGGSGFTAESSVANWQSVEVSGNGYSRFSAVVQTGAYDNAEGRHEIPVINAAFSSTGAGYTYDRVVLYIDGVSTVHSVLEESPGIALLAGQTQTYLIQLVTDD